MSISLDPLLHVILGKNDRMNVGMLILRMRKVSLGINDGMDIRGSLELRVDSMLGSVDNCLSASASEPDGSRATASGSDRTW